MLGEESGVDKESGGSRGCTLTSRQYKKVCVVILSCKAIS